MLKRGATKKAQVMSLEEAVKTYIKDGCMIGFGGFTAMNRNPTAVAWEMVRQGIKNVHCMDRHGSACSWILNAVGAIKIYETDWMGWGEMAGKLDVNLERNYKAGKMILEDYSHGAMAMRFLAGAIGAPFIPYYAPQGSDLYNTKYDALGRAGLRGKDPKIPKIKFQEMADPFYGAGNVMLLPAARLDVAVIHVAQCGEKGTARWRGRRDDILNGRINLGTRLPEGEPIVARQQPFGSLRSSAIHAGSMTNRPVRSLRHER